MLEISQGFNNDILLVGRHAAGTFRNRSDGNALGEIQADAGSNHHVTGTGERVIGQIIHPASGCRIEQRIAADGALHHALVAAGCLQDAGNAGFGINNCPDSRFIFLNIRNKADQRAVINNSHIVFQSVF